MRHKDVLHLILLSFLFSLPLHGATNIPLRVLTYNVWGLPVPVEHAPWRYAEIAARLNTYDVVAFQETWSKKTEVLWKSNVRSHPYQAFGGNPHGLIGGSGLAVISRYPIVETHFEAYHDCSEFECTARKGALMFRVRVRPGVEVDFYQTHLNAGDKEDLVRTGQILQLVGMVHELSIGRPIIVLGDFNADFRSINYDEIAGNLILNDSYEQHLRTIPNPTPEQRNGYTFDIERNPWAAPSYSGETRPQRLDYIFSRGAWPVRFQVSESKLDFVTPVHENSPLSDHYGLTTVFSISAE